MKKIITLLLATMMTVSLVACGGTDASKDSNQNTEAAVNTEAVVNTEATINTEVVANTEADTVATVPTFQWDWDKLVFTFNEDGTFKMELPEYQITEEGTWVIADGAVTVTSPAGKTYTSVMEDGVCKLNYVADASEQLVAQLYTSDYAFLDGAATGVTASNVPAFTWDWDKLEFTFNEDGTCEMALPEYQISEVGTWTANEDGTYTITSPAGKAYTSYIGEDGLVHLDYVADASEQLVAQLYIK